MSKKTTVGLAIDRLHAVAIRCTRVNRRRGAALSLLRLSDIGMSCQCIANSMAAWCLGDGDEANRCYALAKVHLERLPLRVRSGLLRLAGMKTA